MSLMRRMEMNYFAKLKRKYIDMPIALKASLWATICGFSQKGLSLLTTPIFTRLLTTEQYGQVTLYLSWLNIFTIICTLNVTYGGFHNGMVKYPDKREQYTSSTLFLTTVMTSIWCVLYLIFHDYINSFTGLSTLFTLLIFAEIVTKSSLDIWTVRQRYDFKYRELTIITMLTVISTPLIGIIGVYNAQGEGKVLARVLSFVVVYAIVGLIIYAVLLKKGKQLICKEYWGFTLGFNLPLIPHYLSQTVLHQADRVMINNMCSTAEAGIYGLAYNAGMLLHILVSAINSAFIPWMYREIKDKKEKEIGGKVNYILLLLVVLIVAMMLFAPELISILGSEDYYAAVYIVPPVAGSVYFIFLFSLFSNVELYYEKNIWVMIGSFIAAIVNLILNFIFIKIFGYLAAGYTTLASYVIISVLHYIFMKKICKDLKAESNIYDMRVVVPLSIFMIVVSCTMSLFYKLRIIRYALVLVILVALFIKRNAVKAFLKSIKKK